MEYQAEGSWVFRPAFLDAQKNVSGHHDGRVGDEGIEVPALTSFLQFQVLLGRVEEHFDVPAFAVNADNVFIGKGEVSVSKASQSFLCLLRTKAILALRPSLSSTLSLVRISTLSLCFQV